MDSEMRSLLEGITRKRENLYVRRQRIDAALRELDNAERAVRASMALLPEGQNLPANVKRVLAVLQSKPKKSWTAAEVCETLLSTGRWKTSTKNPEHVTRAALSTAVRMGLADGDTRKGFVLAEL